MFIKYILFIIHKTLTIYNKVRMTLFKLFFYPYVYLIRNGNIIECKYISHDMDMDMNYDNLIVTYECDKLYNRYNRVSNNPQILRINEHIYTNYVFTNITLIIDDRELTIYLRNNHYNFYIVNNIINSDFILFYLKNILRMRLGQKYLHSCYHEDNISYKLIILDNQFKQHTLTNEDSLILYKNTFTITTLST